MKFSYSFIKEMVPNLPAKKVFADEFALKSFEVDEVSGDMMEIKITANRWCDAASHMGIAKEAAAIFGSRVIPVKTRDIKKIKSGFKIKVEKKSGCLRYIGCLAELRGKGSTPSWMKKYLKTCGLRPVNAVVDVLNFVMIETGQPMHAFDAEKVNKGIVVRKAEKGEKITTLDGGVYNLDSADTVIADSEESLAIAGIKGGKKAEITSSTKKIIIESANFDPVSVYRTSRRIKLDTDASRRYNHGMSSEKAAFGMSRAIRLFEEICFAKVLSIGDEYARKEPKRVIKFDTEKLRSVTGVEITKNQAFIILKKLGFLTRNDGMIEVPPERLDVEAFEDIVEEVIRIYGLNEIQAKAPSISLIPIHNDPAILFKEKAKRSFSELGFDEIASYSFGDYKNAKIELENPISRDKSKMRPSLIPGLAAAIEKNRRIYDEIKIFEFGKVFGNIGSEHWSLAASVRTKEPDRAVRVLKGAVEAVFKKMGIMDFNFAANGANYLDIFTGGKKCGKLFRGQKENEAFFESNAEILLNESDGESEYAPISPYPSVMRDISLWASSGVTVGDLLETIEKENIPDLQDTDLIDYYPEPDGDRNGVTLRLIFQSYERTLTEAEVDIWMEKVTAAFGKNKGIIMR